MSLPPLAPPRFPPPRKKPPATAPGKGSTASTAGPAKPPRRARGAPAERPGPFASAWPSSALQRQLPRSPAGAQPNSGGGNRRPDSSVQLQAVGAAAIRARPLVDPPGPGQLRSCQSHAAPRRFSLSLPSETLRVLQRGRPEQQPRPPERRGGPAPPRAASPGAAKRPVAGGSAATVGGDLRAWLQGSLLNQRRHDDDMENEEEQEEAAGGGDRGASPAHEGLVRKCTEWLRGVESAAARDRAEKLQTLPHLRTL